jgi:hypothetical protein
MSDSLINQKPAWKVQLNSSLINFDLEDSRDFIEPNKIPPGWLAISI